MSIARTIRKYEHIFDVKAENFIWHHPLLGFFLMSAGMPFFVLLCVCASTVLIVFPMAWILGWL